tara:strand:+ start:1174 stop:1509 length:336 start_codon:yes stop_codon:yes gene_type:complete
MTTMYRDKTMEYLNAIKDVERRNELKNIVVNCESYTVHHNGDQHWLKGNVVLTEHLNLINKGVNYTGCDPFEHWTFETKIEAKKCYDEKGFDKLPIGVQPNYPYTLGDLHI